MGTQDVWRRATVSMTWTGAGNGASKLGRFRLSLLVSFFFAFGAFGAAETDGQQIYISTCSSCHQADGQGVPGVFPPLGQHLAELYEAESGERYLASVVLFGLEGPITVDGEIFDGSMPSWFQLSDSEIAAALNFVMTSFGAADELEDAYEPYTEDAVASARQGALSAQLVHQRRPEVAGASDEEAASLPPATYAEIQAERIQPVYEQQCAECHGAALNGGLIGGPPLRGDYFEQRWSGRSAASLFLYMQSRMPIDRPGALSPQQYVDLLALILQANGHEAVDEELVSDVSVLEQYGILGSDD